MIQVHCNLFICPITQDLRWIETNLPFASSKNCNMKGLLRYNKHGYIIAYHDRFKTIYSYIKD